jgi:hypothetical protein
MIITKKYRKHANRYTIDAVHNVIEKEEGNWDALCDFFSETSYK